MPRKIINKKGKSQQMIASEPASEMTAVAVNHISFFVLYVIINSNLLSSFLFISPTLFYNVLVNDELSSLVHTLQLDL